MSVRVANSRFILSSKSAVLYQRLLKNVSDFRGLGNRLIQEAEVAQSFRQTNRLIELSVILSNLPLSEYRLIGQYYLGWCGYCNGENTREVIEQVVEKSKTYKVKALISLGAVEDANRDYASAARYYSEALKYAYNPSLITQASRGVALLKAKEGNNRQALKELEAIWPVVRLADLHVYHQYLNSFAVELGEAGRIDEAQDICKVLLASPFAFAYPEWRETSDDIAFRGYKSRSAVCVIQPVRENFFKLPIAESSSNSTQEEPAKVFSLLEWKKKMGKEPNGDNTEANQDLNKMSEKELLLEIIQLASQNGVSEHELRDILDHARKVIYGPKKN